MTERLQKALNEQITAELWSANLYLSMSFFLQREGYEGFAHWMRKQAHEETCHANRIAEYMISRQAIPKIDKVDVSEWQAEVASLQDSYQEEYEKYKELSSETKSLRDINKYIDDAIRSTHPRRKEEPTR